MSNLLINILIVICSFICMECVAWITHKYVMHGILWTLHHDHHKKEGNSFFERNDFFFLIFAIPGIVCMYQGSQQDFNYLFWIGIGITLYGAAYFFVHDVFIHQRFKLLRDSNWIYLKALRRAHKSHHKHLDRHDGECFGMLWVPRKYFIEARKTISR